jgi:hypothetical protein
MNAPLPDLPVATAKLPEVYKQARTALVKCSRTDECQKWADKAHAMASYARQAKDDSLYKMAIRIQARAIERCGELLKEYQAKQGGDRRSKGGRPPVDSRKAVAKNAGLSEHQRKTALRVANVPKGERDALIESDNPLTVTQLAERGKEKKPLLDLGTIKPQDFSRATHILAELRRLAEFAAANEPTEIAAGVMKHELRKARAHVATVEAWLSRFVASLGD